MRERSKKKERRRRSSLSLSECSWCHFQNGGANKREPACISLSFAPSSSPCGKRRQLARHHALLALSLHLTLPAAANQRRATCQAVQWHVRSAAELLLVQVMSINGSKNNSSSLFRARRRRRRRHSDILYNLLSVEMRTWRAQDASVG